MGGNAMVIQKWAPGATSGTTYIEITVEGKASFKIKMVIYSR